MLLLSCLLAACSHYPKVQPDPAFALVEPPPRAKSNAVGGKAAGEASAGKRETGEREKAGDGSEAGEAERSSSSSEASP